MKHAVWSVAVTGHECDDWDGRRYLGMCACGWLVFRPEQDDALQRVAAHVREAIGAGGECAYDVPALPLWAAR